MSKPLLLVVDDDPDMGALVSDVARELGFAVRAMASVAEFKEFWAGADVAAIVTDVVMPDTDGLELLAWLARNDRDVPVIILSGYGGRYCGPAKDIGRARGVNVIGALAKPFAIDELEAMLGRVHEVAA